VKPAGVLLIGISTMIAWPLWADPPVAPGNVQTQESPYLKRHEKNLKRMQADRDVDNENTRQAQEEYRQGTVEMSGHVEQQRQDVENLKSVETQVAAGQNQKTLAHQSYKDTVRKYGSEDPRSTVAKKSWKQSQQAMDPLLESRQTLKDNVHRGGRQVHNDKTVLDFKKRAMHSNARYRAGDDRKIQQEEKNIADDRRAMTESVQTSELPSK